LVSFEGFSGLHTAGTNRNPRTYILEDCFSQVNKSFLFINEQNPFFFRSEIFESFAVSG